LNYDIAVAGQPRVDRPLAAGVAHRIGPFVVETVALPGHTADGTGYRVRALDVLAVGDHLSAVEFPFVSSTADYRMTLAGLIDLLRHDPPARVVPGHGPPLTAAEALAIAEADLAYLRALRDAVAGALAANADRGRARAAGLAVEVPRAAPGDLAGMRAANVEAQLNELLPQ
jgi:glyoxylase-like metal-dependent hydrolase (beta-lactamase superfamily II)